MKFSVLGLEEKQTGSFGVAIEVMYGDADGYGKMEIRGFKKGKDEGELSELLRLLDDLQYADCYEISSKPGFDKWFNQGARKWLTDPTNHEYAVLDSFEVLYYDENDVCYKVDTERELEERLHSMLNEWAGTKPEEMTAEYGHVLLEQIRDIAAGGEI